MVPVPMMSVTWVLLSPEMLNLTTRLCWNFLKKDGYIAIWQKPSNNSCYLNREKEAKPPMCDPSDDPDNIWYCVLAFLLFGLLYM